MQRVEFDTKLERYSINEDEFLLFRDYIIENCGISIPPEKAYLIETRLTKLMFDVGAESFGEFHKYIVANPNSPVHKKIINAITTNETLWFRDVLPWKALEEIYLPQFIEELLSGRKARVRIWSAAVSTGQEIYSTVMCIDDYLKKNNIKGIDLSNFDFFATDISNNVLDIAKKGRYDKISIMRGLDNYYKERYFTQSGSAWDIDPKIRSAVRFENFNLQKNYHSFGLFDVIFCRYVLIYFSDTSKKDIVTKMNNTLADGGVLFTGNYILYDLFKDGFDVGHYDNLTYYTKGNREQENSEFGIRNSEFGMRVTSNSP